MKFLRSKYLLIGIIAGLLAGGGWFAWGAIQSQVGVNIYDPVIGSWWPNCQVMSGVGSADGETVFTGPGINNCRLPDVQTITMGSNGTSWDRVRTVGIGDAGSTGILASGNYGFNGATWDRLRSGAGSDAASTGILNIGGLGFNGATWDRLVSTTNNADAKPTSGQGNLNIVTTPYIFNGTSFDRVRSFSDTTGGRVNSSIGTPMTAVLVRDSGTNQLITLRGVDSGTLSATTSNGISPSISLSTWSCNNTATAGQASCSKAAGGGTVRHVAVSVTACILNNQIATGASALINLRDGATGAGTVIWSGLIGAPIVVASGVAQQNAQCINMPIPSMIGTANTAMTLEFSAATPANVTGTVTLNGFSVP